jgi:hypothetical protein
MEARHCTWSQKSYDSWAQNPVCPRLRALMDHSLCVPTALHFRVRVSRRRGPGSFSPLGGGFHFTFLGSRMEGEAGHAPGQSSHVLSCVGKLTSRTCFTHFATWFTHSLTQTQLTFIPWLTQARALG